jgi:two-component system, cell cycle response regulator DivK
MAKILLVEDNPVNSDMLSRRLEKRGFQVIRAVDGQAAIEMALENAPNLVLMDMHLPVIDGWEATRRLKENEATSAIPVIALTADAMSGDREKALESGCDDYETKPVMFQQLLDKIEFLLKGSDS